MTPYPTRGRHFCPMCDAPVLTVQQLQRHIDECPVRMARSVALHPSNRRPDAS